MRVTQQTVGIDSCPVSVTGTVVRMVCGDRNILGIGAGLGRVGLGLPSGYEPLVNGAGTLVFAGSGNGGNGIAKHLRGSSRAERGVWWGGGGSNCGAELGATMHYARQKILPLRAWSVRWRLGQGGGLAALGCPKIKNGRPRHNTLNHD
jgi:hypothetical protein